MYLRTVAILFEKVHYRVRGFFDRVILLDLQDKNEVAWVLIEDTRVALAIRSKFVRVLVQHLRNRQYVTKFLLSFLDDLNKILELVETCQRGHSFNLILYTKQ